MRPAILNPEKHNAPELGSAGRCRGTSKGLEFQPSRGVSLEPLAPGKAGRWNGMHRQDRMLPESRASVLALPVVKRPTFSIL